MLGLEHKELKSIKGLHKKTLKGLSGVTHSANVVTTDDGEYVFVYCNGGPNQEFELIKHIIIALDTNLGLYIKAEKPIPQSSMKMLSKLKRVIIDNTTDE